MDKRRLAKAQLAREEEERRVQEIQWQREAAKLCHWCSVENQAAAGMPGAGAHAAELVSQQTTDGHG